MLILEKIKLTLKKSLLDLLYPKVCTACDELISEENIDVLCTACLANCKFADLANRCLNCFDIFETLRGEHCCRQCEGKPALYHKVVGVFEKDSPLRYLVHAFKSGKYSLAPALASLAFLQFEKAGLMCPEYIVPVPSCFLVNHERGYKTTSLIAHELAALLQCKVFDSAVWLGDNIRQSEKTVEQRKDLPLHTIHVVKKGEELTDKRILVLDDERVTGRTLYCTADSLLGCYPRSLEALVLSI